MSQTDTTLDDLLAAVRAAADAPGLEWADEPVPLEGGFWAQMWRVRLTGAAAALSGDLVARVMPDPIVGVRETAVQSELAATGYATPSVRLADGPGPHLDRAWMLMDHAEGHPMLDDLSGPSALLRLPRIARDMPDRLAIHAAELHRIDEDEVPWAAGREDDVGELLQHLHDQAGPLGRPDLVALARWLRAHRPAGESRAICHGDLHPFNILTAPSGDTVLDWSNARVAHPAYDFAYTHLLLSHPPLATPRPLRPVIDRAGQALGHRFLRTYAAETRAIIDADMLSWFTLLHALRIFSEVAIWEDQDELADHSGHPFLVLRGPLGQLVSATTDADVNPG